MLDRIRNPCVGSDAFCDSASTLGAGKHPPGWPAFGQAVTHRKPLVGLAAGAENCEALGEVWKGATSDRKRKIRAARVPNRSYAKLSLASSALRKPLRATNVPDLTRSIPNPNATLASGPMSDARLRAHVARLVGEIGERNVFQPAALHAAADYIRREWTAMGYDVAIQIYQAAGVLSENLEVTRTGQSRPSEIVLIGAHYDSMQGSPGANDNASGIAALLEISRESAHLKPECSVRFVAFVNEEPPFFYWGQMGSVVYPKAARARSDDIKLMVSLEMLGCYSDEPGSQSYPVPLRFFYPDRGNFIAFGRRSQVGMSGRRGAACRGHRNCHGRCVATAALTRTELGESAFQRVPHFLVALRPRPHYSGSRD
jgi:hypothetical protein